MTLAVDLLNPSAASEQRRHKLKRLVQSPNSYFMDVKCPGCFAITTVFSHAQTVVLCAACGSVLCQPTGGKARLTEELSGPLGSWVFVSSALHAVAQLPGLSHRCLTTLSVTLEKLSTAGSSGRGKCRARVVRLPYPLLYVNYSMCRST
ncbi:ribosomal protein S27-domain-containing protein [Trametes polyzona]|nr:ribosomal protein S27-domain-containing protein [Trametes polyzona]